MAKKKRNADPSPPLRLEWRSPVELASNPHNWRTHPDAQLTALADVIAEVGWAGACLFNERTGRLIDGHGRKQIALNQGCEKVPVLIGSWDEATEAKILATLDPLGAMAEADTAKLEALLREVSTDSEALEHLLGDLARDVGIIPAEITSALDPGPQLDRAAELQVKWQTATGQLWVIPSKTAPPRRVKICPHCQHKNPVK